MRTIVFLRLFVLCISFHSIVVSDGFAAVIGSLKVMTFNIKGAAVEIGLDQEQSWDYLWNNSNDRRDRVVSVINGSGADIIGVQELRFGQLEYMDGRLAEYSYFGVGRSTGTTQDPDERSGIFYKTGRFSQLGRGQFWLSETPDTPGTTFQGNGGDTNNPRMATWLKLRDNHTNQSYFVINTHWALDSEARRLSGVLMRDTILGLADGLPIIVTGDFNETAASGLGYAALVRRRNANEFQLTNSYLQSGATAGRTFHGYNGGVSGTPIDFVLHSTEHFQAVSGAIVRTTFGGYYPSDHYPVEVTLNVIAPDVLGDYDGNGSVGTEDYVAWKKSFAAIGSSLAADGNNNHIIDAADYVIWRSRLGSGASAASQLVVPEPTTNLLIVLAGLLIFSVRNLCLRPFPVGGVCLFTSCFAGEVRALLVFKPQFHLKLTQLVCDVASWPCQANSGRAKNSFMNFDYARA